MIYKGLLAIVVCSVLLFGSLVYLPARSDASGTLQNSSVDLSINTASFMGFGTVGTTSTRVLASGWVMINLQATGLDDYDAASLRVYTENDAGDPGTLRRGMVGQTEPTDTVPFKLWTPNFGMGIDNDGDGVPDVESDLNWKDNVRAVWAYAFDKNDPVPEAVSPWDHPLFNYTDLFKWSNAHPNPNFHLPSSSQLTLQQPVRLALVLEQKARPQVYSTQVYFEFALSDDFGDTFTTYTTSMTLSVTLNDTSPIVNLEVDTGGFNGFPSLGLWSQRMMASSPLTLTLSAYGLYPYDAATVRVYTKNDLDDPDQVHMGLVGDLDPDATVHLKVWTPNFGLGIDEDGDGIPDINNETNWRDNEKAVWVFAFDWNKPITETWWAELPPEHDYYDPQCAWCHPLFNYTDLFKWSDYNDRVDKYGDFVYHLPHNLELTDRRPQGGVDRRVPLYIAADFTDALPQTYSTTLYIEFAFSSDKGDTIARSEIRAIDISATVPGDGSPINWLLNRVNMRPDMDASNGTVEKLADSNQEPLDWADTGWIYDQALMVMALTATGHHEQAREILNGLQYLQNDDGSWFFSYMTSVTDQTIEAWVTTDKATLYDGDTCLTEAISEPNDYPDELEKRACWDVTHNLDKVDQIGPWILKDYTAIRSPQTQTLLPDKIKYRTTDFRKFLGANAWVIMAINFYQMQTGNDSYREMALKGLDWIESHRDTDPNSPTFGGVAMGRVWHWWRVEDTITTTYGFIDWPIYVTEHNLDAYSAYRGMGRITEIDTYTQTAELIKDFLLRELWAPHIDLTAHPELAETDILNVFFPGIDMQDAANPHGLIAKCIFLDGQSWAVLALGPGTQVQDMNGMTTTVTIALDYLFQKMLVTNTTIFSGTGYVVTGIDGFKENDGNPNCESTAEDLVWSEGSEGVVAALYATGNAGNIAKADYYHAETASYMMANGGVPYSTLPPNPSDLLWNWTDTNSIAGTAWFYLNEPSVRLNPFRYWTYPSPSTKIYLPIILKRN
jgi:hypothetical protein